MSYWKDRQKALYDAMEKDERKLNKRLSSFYEKESKKLDNEIASFYTKYGEDNILEYRNLMQTLPEADRQLLIEKQDAFIKKYPQYQELLPVRNDIYKLNRLEGLQYSVKLQQLEIGAVNNEEISKYLEKQAERGVNASAEAMGLGTNFNALSGDIAKKVVGTAWSNGKNFSQRIWENTEKLANYLNNDIASGFARGDSYKKLSKAVQDRFNKVSKSDAQRLIYTEGTYVMAESSITPFEEDFEKYRVSTVGDARVCSKCREIAGQVFYIKDREAGVNFPPFHPWCRCSFTIEVDDWDEWMDEYVSKAEQKNKLTENEVYAIKKYISFSSYILNEKLRNGIKLTNEEKKWTKNLDRAIMKMPIYKGVVYRSLSSQRIKDMESFHKKYSVGCTVTEPSYTSASTEIYDENMDILFIIEGKDGSDLREYNQPEQEILFKRGTAFFVLKKEGNEIWLKEI